MSDQECQKGGIKTKIIVDTEDSLTGLSEKTITYKKPVSGTVGAWPAIQDGETIYFITASVNDLDEVGIWELQANVKITDWEGPGKITYISVLANLS